MKRMPPSMWLLGAFVYFVVPLDGDFAFPIGFIDDLIVVVFCIKKFSDEMHGPGPGRPGGMAAAAKGRLQSSLARQMRVVLPAASRSRLSQGATL